MEPNEPKHGIGFRVMAYCFELIITSSLIWLFISFTKKNDWERDTMACMVFIILSAIGLWVIYHPNHQNEK